MVVLQRDVPLIVSMRAALRDGTARRLRLAHGLSQREVGAACGITGQAVARWESHHRVPRGDVAVHYARLLARLGLPKEYTSTAAGEPLVTTPRGRP